MVNSISQRYKVFPCERQWVKKLCQTFDEVEVCQISHTYLHPFQIHGVLPPGSQPMFQRGRLDHCALNAASEAAFREIHRRVLAEGRDDGVVTDMGSMLRSVSPIPIPVATRWSG